MPSAACSRWPHLEPALPLELAAQRTQQCALARPRRPQQQRQASGAQHGRHALQDGHFAQAAARLGALQREGREGARQSACERRWLCSGERRGVGEDAACAHSAFIGRITFQAGGLTTATVGRTAAATNKQLACATVLTRSSRLVACCSSACSGGRCPTTRPVTLRFLRKQSGNGVGKDSSSKQRQQAASRLRYLRISRAERRQ